MREATVDVDVRAATISDSDALARIYNFYIRATIATFEEVEVSAGEMGRRLAEVQAASLPWLVADEHDQIIGYAYATNWKRRIGYRNSAEVTVYLDQANSGRGIGSMLYERLLSLLA